MNEIIERFMSDKNFALLCIFIAYMAILFIKKK